MGSPTPTVRCAGGTIEVDVPDGTHVFEEASGRLIETRRQFRDSQGDLYSLETCRCGHPVHTGTCTATYWREYDQFCWECGADFRPLRRPWLRWLGLTCLAGRVDGAGYYQPCGCETFTPRRLR